MKMHVTCLMIIIALFLHNAASLNEVEWKFLSGATVINEKGTCGAQGAFSPAFVPGAREKFSMTRNPGNRDVYIFGGKGYGTQSISHTYLGDIWAYNGQWAWMGGFNNSGDYPGSYTGPNPYPGGRQAPSMWYSDSFVYILGGYGKDVVNSIGNLNDLWTFSTIHYNFSFLGGSTSKSAVSVYNTLKISSPSNQIGAGSFRTMLRSSNPLIFGGFGFDTNPASDGYTCDVWRFNLSSSEWIWQNGPSLKNQYSSGGSSGVFSQTYFPGSRSQSVMIGDANKRIYLFGGKGFGSTHSVKVMGDVWAYDTVLDQWAYITGVSTTGGADALAVFDSKLSFTSLNRPGCRMSSSGGQDPNSDLMLLFGGEGYDYNNVGYLNDFWAFNASQREWAWVGGSSKLSSTTPTSRYGDDWSSDSIPGGIHYHAMTRANDGLIMFGGKGRAAVSTLGVLNSMWMTKGPTTAFVTPTPLYPVQWRWMSGSSVRNQKGFHGNAGQFSSQYTPGSRYYASSTTMFNGMSMLFGGYGYNGAAGPGRLGDVWSYRQSCWSCRGEWAWLGGKSDQIDYKGYYEGPTPYPGSRINHISWFTPSSLLYIHAGNGKDGLDSDGYLSDLWTFEINAYTWKWIKGSSIKNQVSVHGAKGTAATANVPGSTVNHKVLKVTSDGTAYISCGNGYDESVQGYLSDTFKYSNGTNEWTWISGPGIVNQKSQGSSSGLYSTAYYPGGRQCPAVMPTTSLIYVFGGHGYSADQGVARLADLWAYNINMDGWAYIKGESSKISALALGKYGSLGHFSTSNHPGSRSYTAGFSDPNSDLILLFGGNGFAETSTANNLNDLWSFNTTKKQWAWTSGDSIVNQMGKYSDSDWFSSLNKPGGRFSFTTFVDTQLGFMYVFSGIGMGGSTNMGQLNDLWITKGPTQVPPTPTMTPLHQPQWRWLSGSSTFGASGKAGATGMYSANHAPGARYNAAMTDAYNHHFYLIGGFGFTTSGNSGLLGDIWSYRQSCWSCTGEWAFLGGQSDDVDYKGQYEVLKPYPGSRISSVAWFSSTSHVYLHGGSGQDGLGNVGHLSDLWKFDINTNVWTWVKGSSVYLKPAVYGAKGTADGANVPGSMRDHVMLAAKSDEAWIFGGMGYDSVAIGFKYLCDVWKLSSRQWTWVSGPGEGNKHSIGGSSGHYSATYYPGGRYSLVSMHRTNTAYVFGGTGYSSAQVGRLTDLWAFHTVTSEWSYIAGESNAINEMGSYGRLRYFSEANHPGSRLQCVGYADPNSDLIVVFGGNGYPGITTVTPGRLNDFWAFNATVKQFAWVGGDSILKQNGVYADSVWFSSANKLGGRYGMMSSSNHDFGIMYLFGGHGYVASGANTGSLNDLWATKGPTVVVGTMPTPTVPFNPTPTPSPSTQSFYIAGSVVSAITGAAVLAPSIASNAMKVESSDKGPSIMMLIDVFQFIAITSQLVMPLPVQYRDFASAFSWALPVIKAPFDFVGKDQSSRRRLLALSQVFDSKQAALNYLPSLLFWTVIGFGFVMLYIFVVDRVRVSCLGHKHDMTSFWRRSIGTFLRLIIVVYYALCYATFLALTQLTHLGIFVIAIISLLVICISIPLIWTIHLLRYPLSHEDLQIANNRVLIMALISGYKEDKMWFSALFLTHKFITALCVALIPLGYVQIGILLLVYSLMLGSLVKWKPHESPTATKLWAIYMLVQVIEFLVLFIVSFFVMEPVASMSISVVLIVANMIGLIVMVIGFLRSRELDKLLLNMKRKPVTLEMNVSGLRSERVSRL